MWRNNKVLVIDDNSSRRHDLNVLLEFLSEPALVAGSDQWRAAVADQNNGEDYVAVFIGDYRASKQHLTQLLKEVRHWND